HALHLHPFPTRRSSDLTARSCAWVTTRLSISMSFRPATFSSIARLASADFRGDESSKFSVRNRPAKPRSRSPLLHRRRNAAGLRSEEHTSELQSRENLV